MSTNESIPLRAPFGRDRGDHPDAAATQSGAERNKKWWFYRQKYPELQLTPLNGDGLTWLCAGNPDPKLSLDYWSRFKTCWADYRTYHAESKSSLAEKELLRSADVLTHLFNQSPFTFLYSGWTNQAIADLVTTTSEPEAAF